MLPSSEKSVLLFLFCLENVIFLFSAIPQPELEISPNVISNDHFLRQHQSCIHIGSST